MCVSLYARLIEDAYTIFSVTLLSHPSRLRSVAINMSYTFVNIGFKKEKGQRRTISISSNPIRAHRQAVMSNGKGPRRFSIPTPDLLVQSQKYIGFALWSRFVSRSVQ